MRADNSHHLVEAARRRSAATRERAIRALRRLAAAGDPVSMQALARAARVSRSWLYAQPDLRAVVQRLRARQDRVAPASLVAIPVQQRASEASLRQRLEAVHAEIRRLREENRQLRAQLAAVHGELRVARRSDPGRSRSIGPCS
jgi:hypothetical protein